MSNSRTVYSTETGRVCPAGGQPDNQRARKGKQSSPAQPAMPRDGVVRVSRETKGRKGKGVTLVHGVPLHPDGLKDLAKELKQRLGTGGAVKNGVIEIQGDHRDVLVEELAARGYTVKRAGG